MPEELPKDLEQISAALSGERVVEPCRFLVEQAVAAGDPSKLYLPAAEPMIRALAAAKQSEVEYAILRFRTRYGKDFLVRAFKQNVAEIRSELQAAIRAKIPNPTRLIRNSNGTAIVTHQNAWLYMQTPEWDDVLAFNEFTGGVDLLKDPPEPCKLRAGQEIDDNFDTDVTRWIEQRSGQAYASGVVHRVIDSMAADNSFHPVRQYLESLTWDGKPRLSDWLVKYCGVEPKPDQPDYPFRVARAWMISAVARIYAPGCKADHVLILEGSTGIGKSSVARLLASDQWFTDQLGDIGSPNAEQQTRGVWIIEIAELHAFSRSDETAIKKFISQTDGRARFAYKRRVERFARQCVFIGTTEKEKWLRPGETARRFWPVKCNPVKDGMMDLAGLKEDRDQLWAEAVFAYKNGEPWHFEQRMQMLAIQEQSNRNREDVWTDRVLETAKDIYLAGDSVNASRILSKMGLPIGQHRREEQERISTILSQAKWRYRHRDVAGMQLSEFIPGDAE